MYAVIKTGGKQYRVAEGQTLKVEKLPAEEGSVVEFDQVLLMADEGQMSLGAPFIAGGKVIATVKNHGRGDKVDVVKFRRRKHHRKQMGHRQYYTEVQITGIETG